MAKGKKFKWEEGKKDEIGLRELTILSLACGAVIIYMSFTHLSESPSMFGMMTFVGAFVGLGIPMTFRYMSIRKTSVLEARFPEFLRDVTSNIETGMTLPQAIRTVCKNDYGPLSPYIKEISNKLEWGISFETVLENFAEATKSITIKRSVKTINETHRSGGYIGTVLEAVAESQMILERIKKERSSSIYAQMINGYVIYFVFLGVMYGLSEFLLPVFQTQGAGLSAVYNEIFRNLVVIQGFFAGISIGKMAEGSVFAGTKHALALVSVGYLIFTIL